MGALVVLAAQAGAIEPGAEAETVVLVRNTGDGPETFHVIVQGEPAAWSVVDPPSLTLDPGAEAPVWVHFRPPRSPETRPGTVPFDIVVAALGDPDFLAVERGEIQVGTYASLAASFDGDVVAGPRWSDLAVRVRNTGNRKVNVSVVAEAGAPGVNFDIEPDALELTAGQSADVLVRVRPPRRLLPRRTDRHVTVSVISDGGALATLRTQHAADPSLVDELFRSARVLLVVLFVLFLGGVALLRSDDGEPAAVTTGADASLPSVPPTEAPPEDEAPVAEEVGPEEVPTETAPALAERLPAAAPPLPRMVFVRIYGPSSRDVVVREPRGAELRLRSDGAIESRPRLSPDGDQVAFVRERGAVWRICVGASAGGEAVCVADVDANAAVAWSRDGKTLYFSRAGQLFSIAYDVATQVAGPETDLGVRVPTGQFAIAPDGTRVVSADGRKLVVEALDGGPSATIAVPAPADDPSFSPDGSRVVFTSGFQIFTAPVSGGAIRQMTAPSTVNGEAAWTAAGDWVVFRSNRSGTGDLYCVKGDASRGDENGLAQVTNSGEREVTPSF